MWVGTLGALPEACICTFPPWPVDTYRNGDLFPRLSGSGQFAEVGLISQHLPVWVGVTAWSEDLSHSHLDWCRPLKDVTYIPAIIHWKCPNGARKIGGAILVS